VVESFDTRDQLIAEFRRASRYILKASHAVFFLLERDGFRADRGTSFVPLNDPLVAYFENHPTVIDGTIWESRTDPIAELAVRNYLAVWGARLLVPIHENCRLLGLIALGVRNDGRAYDESDRSRAVSFARLLRHFLAKSVQLGRLNMLAEQVNLGAKYLPRTLVIGPNESIPREVPLVVRDLVGQVRHAREVRRISAGEGQPFRASAGLISETGGIWAFWEEASAEVHDASVRARADRRSLLREIALTLSHELSNGLVSLAIFRQLPPGKALPAPILETARADVARLEDLNRDLSLMQTLHETVGAPVDMRELAEEVGASLGLRVETGPEPVNLSVARGLMLFALRALVATVGENRPGQGLRELSLQVRVTGEGPERTALLSLKGKRMELEGILPEPMDGSVPNQGRLGVFLAKEILRLHHGEIHAGPGLEGTEILFSVRSL
jgi:signal transduction histidine kinase